MGISKIVILSGVYLILGMYTMGFTTADGNNSLIAESVANSIQAEQIARTGISLAMTRMGSSFSKNTYVDSAFVMNGKVIYSAAGNTSQSQITSTATFSGKTIVIKSVFNYDKGRWRIVRMYVPPAA